MSFYIFTANVVRRFAPNESYATWALIVVILASIFGGFMMPISPDVRYTALTIALVTYFLLLQAWRWKDHMAFIEGKQRYISTYVTPGGKWLAQAAVMMIVWHAMVYWYKTISPVSHLLLLAYTIVIFGIMTGIWRYRRRYLKQFIRL